MELIVEMRFGSHLYGTASPASDLDYKAVYLPSGRDILLQRVRPTMSVAPEKARGERNAAGDIDREIFSLDRYLDLLAGGQASAVDMLFAPDWAMTMPPAPLWREIQANSARLVTRRASSFLRYCQQQANKFGIKGARVAEARRALAMLASAEATHGSTAKLAVANAEIAAFVDSSVHATLVDLPMPNGRLLRHLEVCGKKMPYSSSIKSAREIAGRLVDEYGQRALQAERSEGVDWKALSHAVRVGREAVELFTTRRINFPLSCAPELIAIRRGELAYAAVAETIEQLLLDLEMSVARCDLPEEPDQEFIDELVVRSYRGQVWKNT